MRPKTPPKLPKFPCPTEERPPQVIDVYFTLTEEQKKWPVVPLSKMMGTKRKPTTEPKPVDPS